MDKLVNTFKLPAINRTLNLKTMNIQSKQKRTTKKQMEQIELLMLFKFPGYQWLKENQNIFERSEENQMKFTKVLNLFEKSFRYYHLNRILDGNYLSDEAQKRRRRQWIEEVKLNAVKISHYTGVDFKTVFYDLYDRLKKEIWK